MSAGSFVSARERRKPNGGPPGDAGDTQRHERDLGRRGSSASSAGPSSTRSRRECRTRLSPRSGSTGRTCRSRPRPTAWPTRSRPRSARLRRRERDEPAQARGCASLPAQEPAVREHAGRAGRGIEGASTDAAILAALTAERPVVLGDGGAATAFVQALPHARRFSRRADWPPVVDDADLVVNATSDRDDASSSSARPGARRPPVPGDRDGGGRAAGGRAGRRRARGARRQGALRRSSSGPASQPRSRRCGRH